MNYSNFLNKALNNSLNKKVKNKNCYRPSSYNLGKKQHKLRSFLLFSILSFSILFSLYSYSTTKSTSINTASIADENITQTTTLELPKIAHHSVPETEPSPLVEPEEKTEENKQPEIKDTPLVKTQKAKVQNNTVLLIEPPIDNATEKAPPKKTTIIIASSEIKIKPETESKIVIVKKGDSLSAIFKRLSLSANTLYKIINSGEQAKQLKRIKPGQEITIYLNNNKLDSLHYEMDKVDTLVIKKINNKFTSYLESKEIEVRQQFATTTIENSLFLAGNKAGLSSAMIMQLAQIFGWDIDFALDVRKGDSFTVLYEEKFINDKKFSNGHILSAEFINKGKSYTAVRFTDKSGHTDYYSEKGMSMRKAFLRTPVEFSRISSRFSYARKHPVLNKTRAHKGVDYAASRGTPIKAVGKGKVIFKGTKGGYGRVVILQHGSKYSTLYAHMKSYNRNIKRGTQVKQGQTIGYVGSSGLATGPHLHYEFRVNGVHRNPLTVSLPTAAPIEKKYRSDFQSTADTLISQLKSSKQETIALKE